MYNKPYRVRGFMGINAIMKGLNIDNMASVVNRINLNYTHSKLRDNKIMKTYQATPPS
jgi:hypothetical protein